MTAAFPVSERNKVRRLHERGCYDREALYTVLGRIWRASRPAGTSMM